MASENNSFWTESLFECTKNPAVCIWGFCVPCGPQCMQGIAVNKAHDGKTGCCAWCLLAYYLWCVGAAVNRGSIKKKLKKDAGLEGEVDFISISDVCIHCFCNPCASCQEYREVSFRKSNK